MGRQDDTRKIALLKRSRYFHELTEFQLAPVVPLAEMVSVAGGETIIAKGARSDRMYVLESGVVDVVDEDAATGAERLLRRLASGACFGEIGFLTGRLRTATVRAREAATLLCIRASDFERLLFDTPEVAVAVCRSLADWLYNTSSRDVHRWVKLADFPYQTEAVLALPVEQLASWRVLPLHRDELRALVGMVDPTDLVRVEALRLALGGVAVETVAIAERELDHFLTRILPRLALTPADEAP